MADSARPSQLIRRTRGEAVRASWSDEENQVVRIGEITERVLGEYPDATLGRVTAAERAAVEAAHTTNEGNVIVVPVNVGYRIEDVQAVRLDENFSMLCGNRFPDGAVVAAAFCFREPRINVHEAENMVVRWGYPIELVQADALPQRMDPGMMQCPSCGAACEIQAERCPNCGYDGGPFQLPVEQRRQMLSQPIAINLNVNGATEPSSQPSPTNKPSPAQPPQPDPIVVQDPGPPPGWASHETELLFRSLMSEKNLWNAAMDFASQHRRDAEAVANHLRDKVVPREMLQRLATGGWDSTKVDWLQIAHQLCQRAPHPRPTEP